MQHVDGEALEQLREAPARLGPGQRHLQHAVLVARMRGRARRDEGLELPGVEVPPRALLGVVVEGELGATGRARPRPSFVVRGRVPRRGVLRQTGRPPRRTTDRPARAPGRTDRRRGRSSPPALRPWSRSDTISVAPSSASCTQTSPGSEDGRSPSENRSAAEARSGPGRRASWGTSRRNPNRRTLAGTTPRGTPSRRDDR